MLTSEAISYTWHQLLRRAGVSDFFNDYIRINDRVIRFSYCYQSDKQKSELKIIRCSDKALIQVMNKKEKNIRKIPLNDVLPEKTKKYESEFVPIIFWGRGYQNCNQPIVKLETNGQVVFYADIIASSFYMLSRVEEIISESRDIHDRYPASESLAYRYGFLDQPIVDYYGLILRAWIKKLVPSWNPIVRKFSVQVSHDIDTISYYSVRKIGGDIVFRKSLKEAYKTANMMTKPLSDPYIFGMQKLMELSEISGITSHVNLMTAQHSKFNSGYYSRKKIFYKLAEMIQEQGHIVGFHAGYDTYNNKQKFMTELRMLEEALKTKLIGGRQHYLRFKVPYTWRLWEQAGLSFDSTLGFADHEGFRCGTCHPFNPFDIETNQQLDLIEIPLIVMDGTLAQYRRLSPEKSYDIVTRLINRCKLVGGEFSILWHNTSMDGKWKKWFEIYENVMQRLQNLLNN